MCVLTRLQQTWTLVLKLPMCTVRKSVLIWSLYFSSSSENAKKVWFSYVSCAYVHAPYCYKLVTGLSTGATTTREKSGRREHGKARQQCIVSMTPRESRKRTWRTGDETRPVTLALKCLRYKIKKRTLQYLGHMGKLCWLLWEEHSTSLLPSLLSSRTPLKKNMRPITEVMCSNNKEKNSNRS